MLVALVWGVLIEPSRLAYMAFSKFSLVTPQSTQGGPDPAVLVRLESNPDIAKISPSTFIRIELPSLVPGQGFQFAPQFGGEDVIHFAGGFAPEMPGIPDLYLSVINV